MNIVILYHSLSGQTKKLAGLLEAALREKGHNVQKTELRTNKPVKGGSIHQPIDFEVTNLPDLQQVDAICIGGPVWAFGPSTVVYKALLQMPSLKGKKVLPFCTMGFPLKGMGGRNAIRIISKILNEREAEILPCIIIPKMFHDADKLMLKAVRDLPSF